MGTRVLFNFAHCFEFNEAFTSYKVADRDLVARAIDDFVRFARHVDAMVVEHLPLRREPTDVPLTRFIAISPSLRLETRNLPTLSDATVYIREALKPFVADDATRYGPDDEPPPGHYSIQIEDDSFSAIWELRDHLGGHLETLTEVASGGDPPATSGPAIPTLTSQKAARKRGKKKAKKKAKKKTKRSS